MCDMWHAGALVLSTGNAEGAAAATSDPSNARSTSFGASCTDTDLVAVSSATKSQALSDGAILTFDATPKGTGTLRFR
jgi:hypothetical protein